MIIPRDNLPERISDQDRLQLLARKKEVRFDVYFALTNIYNERAHIWGAPASTPEPDAQPARVNNAGSIIDHAFLRANIESETSHLASGRAISEAQRSVMEAFDEFST
jgi:hypothetical protein